jgi:hypothetical protein
LSTARFGAGIWFRSGPSNVCAFDAGCPVRQAVGEDRVRVARVPELDEDHEDPVLTGALELDVLPVGDAVHLPLGLALQLVLEPLLERGVLAIRLRAAVVVARSLRKRRVDRGTVGRRAGGGRRGEDAAEGKREHRDGAQSIPHLFFPLP